MTLHFLTERVVRRAARPAGQETQCGVAAPSVPGDQPGHSGGGRPTDDAPDALDRTATDPVRSLGTAARPVSTPHTSFPGTTSDLTRTGGLNAEVVTAWLRAGGQGGPARPWHPSS